MLSTWDDEPMTPSRPIRGHRHVIFPVNLSSMVYHRLLPTTVLTPTRSRCQRRQPGPDIPPSRRPPALSLILDASPTIGLRPAGSKHLFTSPTATGTGTDVTPRPRLVSHPRSSRLLHLPLSMSRPVSLSEYPVLALLSHPAATQPS